MNRATTYWQRYLHAPASLWALRVFSFSALVWIMLEHPWLTPFLGSILVVAGLTAPIDPAQSEASLIFKGPVSLAKNGSSFYSGGASVSQLGPQLVFEGRGLQFAIQRTDVSWLDIAGHPRLVLCDGTEVRMSTKPSGSDAGAALQSWLSGPAQSNPVHEEEPVPGVSTPLQVYFAGIFVVAVVQVIILLIR
jgi:hypothetical protein